MRNYSYKNRWQTLLTPEIVSLLTKIHEFKGEQNLFIETKPEVFVDLIDLAKIQSTEASNKIEGIHTSDSRLKQLVMSKTTPKTRNEAEIAGYRDALNTIHESYDYISVKPNIILQLHRDLYKYSGKEDGGSYKVSDNVIMEKSGGVERIRFKPVEAWETPQAMEDLCRAYDEAVNIEKIDPLLVTPMFVLDFLCIHPFSDGNGRMSRLLTLLLLYRSDYIVGKYISIEKAIEKTKQAYYDTLEASSIDWYEEKNTYIPFTEYMLSVIVSAYKDFEDRISILTTSKSKPERIKEIIKTHLGKITKSEIQEKCPDISTITVQRALSEMLQKGEIIKIGGGRYTSYTWNHEKGEKQ